MKLQPKKLVQIPVQKLNPKAILPTYQTAGSAGADIHACLDGPIILRPMERAMIPTGLALAIPDGYEVQIRARSGLSIKHGITMVNGLGTIDSDYRGELNILLINLGQSEFTIEPAMRIAQMVLAQYQTLDWQLTDSLESTQRGEGGFGSTLT